MVTLDISFYNSLLYYYYYYYYFLERERQRKYKKYFQKIETINRKVMLRKSQN